MWVKEKEEVTVIEEVDVAYIICDVCGNKMKVEQEWARDPDGIATVYFPGDSFALGNLHLCFGCGKFLHKTIEGMIEKVAKEKASNGK